MSTVAFDTLKITEQLEASGFNHEQAKGVVEVLREERESSAENLATKSDIKGLQRDMTELELRLKHDLTIRIGSMMVAIGIVATLVKLL